MPSSGKVIFWIYFDRKMLELTSLLSWVIIHGNMTHAVNGFISYWWDDLLRI